jgi:hypothetical protein
MSRSPIIDLSDLNPDEFSLSIIDMLEITCHLEQVDRIAEGTRTLQAIKLYLDRKNGTFGDASVLGILKIALDEFSLDDFGHEAEATILEYTSAVSVFLETVVRGELNIIAEDVDKIGKLAMSKFLEKIGKTNHIVPPGLLRHSSSRKQRTSGNAQEQVKKSSSRDFTDRKSSSPRRSQRLS